MRLDIKHDIGKEKAIEKIDGFLDKLAEKELPAGIAIENPKKQWSENIMTVSFKAKKGFFGVEIKGTATVFDDHVIIEVDLPAIITSFVSEDEIAARLKSGAQDLLT
ncbi:polyhydroxyalkanoic acid system family protein [bacterium]|nr:polyhydroxyalkanoic acid system family protein [bacterium]